jgi:hypothetical protein
MTRTSEGRGASAAAAAATVAAAAAAAAAAPCCRALRSHCSLCPLNNNRKKHAKGLSVNDATWNGVTWGAISETDMAATMTKADGTTGSLSALLTTFGPMCCGGAAKVRFGDGSSMCTAAADFRPTDSMSYGGETATCAHMSDSIMSLISDKHPGKMKWSAVRSSSPLHRRRPARTPHPISTCAPSVSLLLACARR